MKCCDFLFYEKYFDLVQHALTLAHVEEKAATIAVPQTQASHDFNLTEWVSEVILVTHLTFLSAPFLHLLLLQICVCTQ